MSQLVERLDDMARPWCGRSWEGLIDRRIEAFAQALALRRATDSQSHRVAGDFLEFFAKSGVGLFRDEEEWVFRSLRPTPQVVITALEEHITISSLIEAMVLEAQTGSISVHVLHRLGEVLENHLLMEEEEMRPLTTRRSPLSGAR